MPQDTYTLKLDDSTSVTLDAYQLPDGFDTLSESRKDQVARDIVYNHISILQQEQKPATFKDFAIPLAVITVLALIILWVAKRIRGNPKLYDKIVKPQHEDHDK